MDEREARDTMIVRALETSDDARAIWSDADRVWAGRAAAADVGESATEAAFVVRRATLVLDRLGKRHPGFVAATRGRPLRNWIVPAVAAGAFIVGVAGVDIGPAHRINLLAPPVLALLAWNLAVYVALIAALPVASRRATGTGGGPLRRTGAVWLRDVAALGRRSVPVPLTAAFARFTAEWTPAAAPLSKARAAALLHFGAAMLAAGAIAGLYLRGIALEYRAGWQSTFLDASDVERILRVVLAPGAWLTRIAIPGAGHLTTIAGGTEGENAARWIHLYAATILLVIIVPRMALALVAWTAARRRQRSFPLALEDPYFQRLLRGWRHGTARIAAAAYSYDVPRVNADGLVQLLTRALQSTVDVHWLPATAYGADDVPVLPASLTAAVTVFNLGATPERETHGAFARALATGPGDGAPRVSIVDTSEFVDRFGADARRVAERQDNWRRVLADAGVDALFVRLANPDLARDGAALARRLDRA